MKLITKLHSMDIVHLDSHSNNIMMNFKDTPDKIKNIRLVDYGLSRAKSDNNKDYWLSLQEKDNKLIYNIFHHENV